MFQTMKEYKSYYIRTMEYLFGNNTSNLTINNIAEDLQTSVSLEIKILQVNACVNGILSLC